MRSAAVAAVMLFLLAVAVIPASALAQTSPTSVPSVRPHAVPVYAGASTDTYAPIQAPRAVARTNGAETTAAQTSTISVTYHGFSAQAQAAFQAAVNVWQSIVVSDRVIHVDASWTNLGSTSGILGQAGPSQIYLGDDHYWYPGPLYEARCHCDANLASDSDIDAEFNSAFAYWYLGTDGNAPNNRWDLETVVLHELGHGLGFLGSFYVQNGLAYWGWQDNSRVNRPLRFDASQWSQASDGTQLISYNGTSGSLALKSQLTDGTVFMGGTSVVAALNGRARLYAPSSWDDGSSNSHFDESTYAPGTQNALMTPVLNDGEAIHDPGPAVKAVFADIGWTLADTTPAPSAPSAPRSVTATAGDTTAGVTWNAPASNGGSPVTGYTVTSLPDAMTCSTGGATACTVTGLTNGVSYTFTVTATNSIGTGVVSAPSNPVTPHLPNADALAPTATAPEINVIAPQQMGKTVIVNVSWPEPPDTSGIAGYELQRQYGGGSWTAVALATPTSNSAQVSIARGSNVGFRVRATDGVGNVGAWSSASTAILTTYQEKAPQLVYSSGWSRVALSGAAGGYVSRSTTTNSTATFSFTGTSVGVVSTRAPARGIAQISIDGGAPISVDLYGTAKSARAVIWTPASALAPGPHTVVVTVSGTRNAGATSNRIDVDAFLVWP